MKAISDSGFKKSFLTSIDEENPFVRDSESTYMRYDEINIKHGFLSVTVEYRWKGRAVYTITDQINSDAGEVLSITGVSGRIDFDIV